MAPLPWKAPWRRADNILIRSDTSEDDHAGPGPEQRGNSQVEYPKSNPSSDDISSTEPTTSTTIYPSSTPNPSPPLTITRPASTTDTRTPVPSLSDGSKESPKPSAAPSFSETTTSSTTLVPTSSLLPSSLPTTKKTEPSKPSAHFDAVFSNHADDPITHPSLTSTPSPTLSSKSLTSDTLPPPPTFSGSPSRRPSHLVEPPFDTTELSSDSYTTMNPSLIPTSTLTSSLLSLTVTSSPSQTSSSPLPLINVEKTSSDEPIRAYTSLSDGLLEASGPSTKTPHIPSVTTSLLSTTSTRPSIFEDTGSSTVTTNHAASVIYPGPSPVTSDTPQRKGQFKPEPSLPGSSISVPLDTPTPSPVEVGRIPFPTMSSPILPTTSHTTPTTDPVAIPSSTNVDGFPLASVSKSKQIAIANNAGSTTTVLPTATSFSKDFTTSFTRTTTFVTFSPIQLSGTSTSIPVTQTTQLVLTTILPVTSATNKKIVPAVAIVAPVSAAVVLLLLIGFLLRRNRNRKRLHRASQLTFTITPLSPVPSTPGIEKPESARYPVFPSIPTISGWNDPARVTVALDPFVDPTHKYPDAMRLRNETPRTQGSQRMPAATPALAPAPFAKPIALASTFPDGDGPRGRFSQGSTYDEPVVRTSASSSNFGYAL